MCKVVEMNGDVAAVANLLVARNSIDAAIAAVIGRLEIAGHFGEWLAREVFGVTLETSANGRWSDGRFSSPPLAAFVNVKWYAEKQGALDVNGFESLSPPTS